MGISSLINVIGACTQTSLSEVTTWRLSGKVECFLNLPSRRINSNHGVILSNSTIMHQFSQTLVTVKYTPVKDQTSIVSKHNTEIVNHLQIVKYTL